MSLSVVCLDRPSPAPISLMPTKVAEVLRRLEPPLLMHAGAFFEMLVGDPPFLSGRLFSLPARIAETDDCAHTEQAHGARLGSGGRRVDR